MGEVLPRELTVPSHASSADLDVNAVIEANWAWVYRTARRLGGPGLDAEEITQDVLLVVVERLGEFQGRAQLRTWIMRICLNVVSEHRRRSWRRRRLAAALSAVRFWRPAEPSVDQRLEAARRRDLLYRALERLSEEKRSVLLLREFLQLSGNEVAEILDVPPATVRTRLFHARRDLARILNRQEAAHG